jgi:hypothetical protein
LKKLAFLGGAAGLGLLALLNSPLTQAADHLDSTPSLLTQPMADINDVYAWMDGTKMNLAMTVSPFDDGTRSFGASVQYVFHLTRHAGFPATPTLLAMGEESKVVCTFTSNTEGQCWVIDPSGKTVDYVGGDFSATTGKASASGKVTAFAGRRSDPFFFNLAGFLTARGMVNAACMNSGDCPGVLPKDAAGCPTIGAATVGAIRAELSETQTAAVAPCPANQADCFANANVMAIVVQLDSALIVNDTKKLLGVWGSTHAGQ